MRRFFRIAGKTEVKKNGADQAMTSPPLEERSIMMSAEIQTLLSARYHPKCPEYKGIITKISGLFRPP